MNGFVLLCGMVYYPGSFSDLVGVYETLDAALVAADGITAAGDTWQEILDIGEMVIWSRTDNWSWQDQQTPKWLPWSQAPA